MTSPLDRYLKLRDHLTDDVLGGPKLLKFAWVINLQKGGTLPFVLGLMWWYDCWTITAWVYLGLHGSYGLIWLLKDALFPDPGWEKKITFGGALNAWLFVLGPYWIAPWLIVSQRIERSPELLGAAILLYAVGVALMVGADAQKYFVLRARPGLIVDGFFARTRNPNYLGEMMLYAGFALVAGHWLPWLVLVWVWAGVFLPNMLRKDVRMARHREWEGYRARTGLLFPRIVA
ncbi:MAG: methyltransferase family protein [Pseudomonadota bacterium]